MQYHKLLMIQVSDCIPALWFCHTNNSEWEGTNREKQWSPAQASIVTSLQTWVSISSSRFWLGGWGWSGNLGIVGVIWALTTCARTLHLMIDIPIAMAFPDADHLCWISLSSDQIKVNIDTNNINFVNSQIEYMVTKLSVNLPYSRNIKYLAPNFSCSLQWELLSWQSFRSSGLNFQLSGTLCFQFSLVEHQISINLTADSCLGQGWWFQI